MHIVCIIHEYLFFPTNFSCLFQICYKKEGDNVYYNEKRTEESDNTSFDLVSINLSTMYQLEYYAQIWGLF